MIFDLSGRRALVTGAGGGIGAAIARRLHTQGAHVVLTGRNVSALEHLRNALGIRAEVAVANLRDPGTAAAALRASVLASCGGIDILVANAGISRREPLADTPAATWQEVIEVNLTAVHHLAQAFVPGMAAHGWGRLIAIGSILGETAASGMGAYSASKAGLTGLVKAIALEFAPQGVTANTIAPGYIRTPMMEMNAPEALQAILARIPAGTFGMPEDVAFAALWLASTEARFVTGETLHINGGMFMP